MIKFNTISIIAAAALLATSATGSIAQTATATTEPTAPATTEQEWLKIYFNSGSSRISADQVATLDRAVRTFRDGDPFVMIVSGAADTVGTPSLNLDLSLSRAAAVADALVARGIPVQRLQVLGRGTSELEVATDPGVAEPKNRVVEISWR